MKKLVIFAVLCLCFAANAQGKCQYSDDDIDVEDGRIVLVSTGKPVNGVVCTYHDNGKTEYEGTVKNGKLEGVLKLYYESGKLEAEIPYKNNKREGYGQRYNGNGVVWSKVLYRNDEAVSGACANGRTFTNDDLADWEDDWDDIDCD